MTPELSKVIVGLAWPVVVLILALAYKQEIRSLKNLLPRLRKAKFWQVEVEVDAALQQKTGEPVTTVSSASIELKELPGFTRTEAIGNLERELHANLKAIPENQPDLLIRNLAQARLEAIFGITYATIFGSQISGLVELEARRKVSANEAYEFYQTNAEGKFPEAYATYGFAGWIGFMKNRDLIDAIGEDIRITPQGEDFLKWMRAYQLPANRLF